jgi:hypothetical protein
VVGFVWRYAAYPTGWSRRQQQLRLADFALRAEEDVTNAFPVERKFPELTVNDRDAVK